MTSPDGLVPVIFHGCAALQPDGGMTVTFALGQSNAVRITRAQIVHGTFLVLTLDPIPTTTKEPDA
jgi:hypothetical protein